ncbi:MAG: hypothetical protein Mars2KO_03980 [Maribacter sp.]
MDNGIQVQAQQIYRIKFITQSIALLFNQNIALVLLKIAFNTYVYGYFFNKYLEFSRNYIILLRKFVAPQLLLANDEKSNHL